MQVTEAARITMQEHHPRIETARLTLTPIEKTDLQNYQDLFANAIAMESYLGSARQRVLFEIKL